MATALDRGLKILEILAKRNGPVRFNELNEGLGDISRASLSRLLKDLIANGYVAKSPETGAYSCGVQMAVFANIKAKGLREYLLSTYGPKLKEAAKKFNVTVIMLEKVKEILINIHKEQPAYSMFMQEVENINDNYREPWLLTLGAFDTDVATKIKGRNYQRIMAEIKEQGFLFEDQTVRNQVRRFSFPIFHNEKIVGIIGVGGTILQIDDKKAEEIIKFFKD